MGLQICVITIEINTENYQKAKNRSTYDLVALLLERNPKNKESYSPNTCSSMFPAAPFWIVRKEEQPKCSTVDD